MDQQFFNELQRHSEAKLKILNDYVIPWMRKIVLNRYSQTNRCLIIDGFAGKGKYDETGADGSPLILLKNAINFCDQAESNGWDAPTILLIFVEYVPDNFRALKNNIKELCGLDIEDCTDDFVSVPGYQSILVKILNKSFDEALIQLMDTVGPGETLIPSFCFIDPFGFSQTPFETIKRYLSNESSEILLNFIFEETNRFITHKNAAIQEHMKTHFGVTDLDELKTLIGETKGEERKKVVVDYYSRQLMTESGAKYVLTFEIKKRGRTKLILFHATKNRNGLRLMKYVMWGVDGTGSYLFDDRKTPDDINFTFAEEFQKDILVGELADLIYREFAGNKNVTDAKVEDFILFETNFPIETFKSPALKTLKDRKRIVNVRKRNGTQYRHGFSEVYIDFD